MYKFDIILLSWYNYVNYYRKGGILMFKLNNTFLDIINNILIKEFCLFMHTTPIINFLKNQFFIKGLINIGD